jgi:hypothetical protein
MAAKECTVISKGYRSSSFLWLWLINIHGVMLEIEGYWDAERFQ